MLHVQTIADLRTACDGARATGKSVGFVPTMGYLHEGHRSLMRAARAHNDVVVVSIFVNPLQFAAGEDLERYPRDIEGDLVQCEDEDVDIVFIPSVEEMYPRGPSLTTVHVDRLTADLCGAARPTHFDGVTTIVTKLLAVVGACRAYFGRKDAQQLAVVTRMAADLDLPVEVVGCPIVREADGLAMSSRNAYLTPQQRAAALVLPRALEAAVTAIANGERDARHTMTIVQRVVASEPLIALEYVEARDAQELTPLERIEGDVLIAVAARVGETRLIDNVTVSVQGSETSFDLGSRACTAR